MSHDLMSVLGAALLFIVLFPLPLKIAATMVGARRTGILVCLVAMFLAAVLSGVVAQVAGYGIAALLGVIVAQSVVYWIILQPSLIGAFALSFLTGVVQFVIVWLLFKFAGLHLPAHHPVVHGATWL